MVVSMVPANRIGVYMGILNMMVVVPMLVQTSHLRLGLRGHLLGGKGTNAIMLAGVLLGCGAVATLHHHQARRPDHARRGARRRVADLIRKLGAASQTHNDVSREFLPPADLVRS